MPRLLERRDGEGLAILPLVLKPCMWDQVDWLASMNLRPRDGRPVLGGSDVEIDNDLSEFASEIAQVVQQVARRLQAAELAPEPSGAQSPSAAGAPAVAPPVVGVGSKLGRYEIFEWRSTGPTGDVYLARDSQVHRKVVLKVLRPELAADPERVARFRREAEAVAAINHPNIVTLFSVEEDRGVHFFTRELVEGQSLAEIVRHGPLALDQFFDVAVRLTDVLVAAHLRGFVHRDLKPSYVVVTEKGRVKILDLGMTKLLDGKAELETRVQSLETLAGDGFFAENISYMSPEQVARQPVDHRTDVYSLGVIFYEMATGRKPFTGLSPMDLLSAIMREEPAKVTELNGELPDRLGAVIHRCLEKEPERRYPSTFDLLKELEGLKAELETGQPATGQPATGQPATGQPATGEVATGQPATGEVAVPAPVAGRGDAGRGRWPLLGAAVLAASLLLAAGFYWLSSNGSGAGEAGGDVVTTPVERSALDDSTPAAPAPVDEAPQPAVASPPPPAAPVARDRPPASDPAGATETRRVPASTVPPAASPAEIAADPVPPPAAPLKGRTAPPEETEPERIAEPPAAAAPVEPEPEKSRQPSQQQEKDAILETLRAYAIASESLDAAAVKKVVPDANEEQLEASFSELRSKEVEIQGCDIQFFGSAVAAAACRETVKIVPKRGLKHRPQANTILFKLEKRQGSWIIADRSLAN